MSLLADKVENYLVKYLKSYNLDYLKETSAGFNARFDFEIPTKTKIFIEVDGNYNKNAA